MKAPSLPLPLVYLLACTAGISETLSLAPFDYSLLAIISPALLYLLLQLPGPGSSVFRGAAIGLWFGIGLYGSGASWVYVSINQFGNASPVFAGFLTILFCLLCSLLPIITWSTYCWLRNKHFSWLCFAAYWVLGELLSSWLFTGFPWLHLGYSQATGALGGWAPITGVYGISFILALSGAAIVEMIRAIMTTSSTSRKNAGIACSLAAVCWLMNPILTKQSWTEPKSNLSTSVAMVQANIPQSEKWLPDNIQPTLTLYANMSQTLWPKHDLIIWPEAALPLLFEQAKPYLDAAGNHAKSHQSQLLTGIPYRDQNTQRIYNSAIATGLAQGIYHKRHLVPFGEYIPLESIAGKLMAFFSLPMSTMSPGKQKQTPIEFHNRSGEKWRSLPLICYEIVYPNLTAYSALQSDILITLGNDSWFGKSIGPIQHLQIAQMRARETGRYILRSTGTGVTAIIDPRGNIVKRGAQFEKAIVNGTVYSMEGNTPWVRAGYWLFPTFCATVALASLMLRNKS